MNAYEKAKAELSAVVKYGETLAARQKAGTFDEDDKRELTRTVQKAEQLRAIVNDQEEDLALSQKVAAIGRGIFGDVGEGGPAAGSDSLSGSLGSKVQAAWRNKDQKLSVPAAEVLPFRFKASSFPDPSSEPVAGLMLAGISSIGFDSRYLATALRSQALSGANLVVQDYKETSAATVSGDIERGIVDTSSKAVISVTIDLTADPLRMFAVILEDVPAALLAADPQGLDAFLRSRTSNILARAQDDSVVAAIDASPADSIAMGLDSLEIIRRAKAEHQAAGYKPTVLAMAPNDSANLDLLSRGVDNLPLFSNRVSGDASPMYGMTVVETPSVGEGTAYLIDADALGILYQGPAIVLIDPYSGLSTNVVRIRTEFAGLMHVRQAKAALRVTFAS